MTKKTRPSTVGLGFDSDEEDTALYSRFFFMSMSIIDAWTYGVRLFARIS